MHQYWKTNFVLKRITNKLYGKQIFNNLYAHNGQIGTISISYDMDYKKDVESIPLLIDIMKTHSIKASFAVVGMYVEEFPEIHKEIVRRKHEIVNHTYSHPYNDELKTPKYRSLTTKEKENEISKCNTICNKLLKTKPLGFRFPHFGSEFEVSVYDILEKEKMLYSSSTTSSVSGHIAPFKVRKNLYEFPVTSCPKHFYSPFDTFHSFRSPTTKHSKSEFFDIFAKLIDMSLERKQILNIYVDPLDIISNRLGKIFEIINDKGIKTLTMLDTVKKLAGKYNTP